MCKDLAGSGEVPHAYFTGPEKGVINALLKRYILLSSSGSPKASL